MKQIATIILVLISLTSFGQGGTKFTVKGNGSNVGDSVKKNTDTLVIHNTRIIKNTDSLVSHNTRIGKNNDSLISHNTRIGANTTNIASNTASIALKVNISDTSAMLQKYKDSLFDYNVRIGGNTSNISSNTSSILLKRNISDTAGNAGVTTIFQTNKSKDSLQANIQKNTDSFPKRWGVYGMSGLSGTANFIGNTDNVPIRFRVNNVQLMSLDTATKGQLIMGNQNLTTVGRSNILIADTSQVVNDDFLYGLTIVKTARKLSGATAANGQFWAAQFEPRIGASNTGNWTSTYGMVGVRASNNTQPGSTGTLTWGIGAYGATDYSGMTITNAARFYAQDVRVALPAVVTNNYGIYSEGQISGTNNYNLYLGSQPSSATSYSIYNLAGNNQFIGGSLGDGIPLLNMTATMSTGSVNTQTAIPITLTTAGSASQSQFGINLALAAGYTGASSTIAGIFNNSVAGTGATYAATSSNVSYRLNAANMGVASNINATTTGINSATRFLAGGGNTNYGVWASTTVSKASSTNIAVAGFALNSAGTAQVAGLFALADYGTSAPSVTNAAIIADNGAVAAPIALFRDNGTTKVTIADGGAITSTSTITATQFNYSALSTAPSSASDTGTTGEVRVTNGFIYVCVATNTWQRAAITTW